MASTAPPRACAHSSLGRVSVTACATRSISSLGNSPPSPPRSARPLRTQFHTLLYRARQRKGFRVFALGQRLRHFVDHVTTTVGAANGQRVRHWFQEKKAGWYAVLADPQMPVTSTLLDQAHNAIRAAIVCDERVSPSRWQSTGVFDGARAPGQPGTVSTSSHACRSVWGGSRRRASTLIRLDAQPANPHLGRLSMSRRNAPPPHSVECAFFRSSFRSSFRH